MNWNVTAQVASLAILYIGGILVIGRSLTGVLSKRIDDMHYQLDKRIDDMCVQLDRRIDDCANPNEQRARCIS